MVRSRMRPSFISISSNDGQSRALHSSRARAVNCAPSFTMVACRAIKAISWPGAITSSGAFPHISVKRGLMYLAPLTKWMAMTPSSAECSVLVKNANDASCSLTRRSSARQRAVSSISAFEGCPSNRCSTGRRCKMLSICLPGLTLFAELVSKQAQLARRFSAISAGDAVCP